jgi:excisionase family DNA binding protein
MDVDKLPEILTLKKACEVLSCHPNTLRNWVNKGKVECVRFGDRGDRRFKRQDILNLLNKN